MKRNSNRTYWMKNKSWYVVVDGKPKLTPIAPLEAKKSFEAWKRPSKGNVRKWLGVLIARFH